MSSMELNKGTLRPTGIDTENYTDEDYETLYDNGMLVIDGEVYEAIYEIQAEDSDEGFAYVEENPDGSISFFTNHYNGGGDVQEVIEGVLNSKGTK